MPLHNFTIDDVSPFITYGGQWGDSSHEDPQFVRYANQTFHATQTAGSNAKFSFNGTGVYMFGAKRANHGLYSVSIDGQIVATPSGAGNEEYQQLLYSTSNLAYGLHHIEIANTAAPSYLDLDLVTITTGDGKTETVSQDVVIDHAVFVYDASWTNGTNGVDNGLNTHRTNTPNAVAKIPFHGNAIKLYGTTALDHGMFSVSLDNAPAVSVNGTAPVTRPDTLLCQFDGLPDGDHVLTVENLSSNVLDLDQAVVSSYGPALITSGNTSTAQTGPAPKGTTSITSQTGTLIGLIVGSLVLLALIAVGLYLLLRTRKASHERRHGGVRALKALEAEMDVGDLSDIPAPRLLVNPFSDPEAPPPSYEAPATASSSHGGSSMSPSTASEWVPDRKRRPTLPELVVHSHSGHGEYPASVYSSSQHSGYAPSAAGGSRF